MKLDKIRYKRTCSNLLPYRAFVVNDTAVSSQGMLRIAQFGTGTDYGIYSRAGKIQFGF